MESYEHRAHTLSEHWVTEWISDRYQQSHVRGHSNDPRKKLS